MEAFIDEVVEVYIRGEGHPPTSIAAPAAVPSPRSPPSSAGRRATRYGGQRRSGKTGTSSVVFWAPVALLFAVTLSVAVA